ncbi:MAG: MOSC domain-containing protein [Candidatus Nanopelagicaceae bacterium]|nr:MOSC domain-containing protein [Candidatus Nanopelagicaceae bacterium]
MLPGSGEVISVNVTYLVHEDEWTGSVGRTGIDKRSVSGRVRLAENAVEGDVVADRKNHGGFDKAVYSYSREDANWWEDELGIPISNGRFGENLTTEGISINDAVIGERWSIGTAIVEVSQPRTPCRVFAGFWDRPNLIKEFTNAGRSGAYLRIIEEGDVGAGDEIVIVGKPSHGITISDLFLARGEERSRIFEFLASSESSNTVRQWALNILKKN